MRLSVGAGRGTKGLLVGLGAAGVGIALLFVAVTCLAGGLIEGFVGGLIDSNAHAPVAAGDPGPQLSGYTGTVAWVVRGFGACALPVLAVFAFMVLHGLRYAIWLDGTTAVVRRAVGTRRVDLATADVRGGTVTQTLGNYRYIIAALVAVEPRTGRRVKIPLRGRGFERLPSDELYALADAMMYRRHPGDPTYPRTAAIALRLRQLADDPFPV